MKKYVVFLLMFFILCGTFYHIAGINGRNYLNTGTPIDSEAKGFMPVLDALPEYQRITYKHTHKSFFLFQSDSVILVIKYDDKTYRKEKDQLAERYIFLDANKADEMKGLIPENEFTINSYTFRVVDQMANEHNKKNFMIPKSFGMIGTSDKKKSIAYLYFYDFDLDSIGQQDEEHPMENFVKTYFNYKF